MRSFWRFYQRCSFMRLLYVLSASVMAMVGFVHLGLAGRTAHVPEIVMVEFERTIDGGDVTADDEYLSPCTPDDATAATRYGTSAEGEYSCWVPPFYEMHLRRFQITGSNPAGINTTNCRIGIETSQDATALTGTMINTSIMRYGFRSGANPAGICYGTSAGAPINVLGSTCTRYLNPADRNSTVVGPGWFRVKGFTAGCLGHDYMAVKVGGYLERKGP